MLKAVVKTVSQNIINQKKENRRKKIIKYKRSYNEDENDYDNVDRTVENSEESEHLDEDDYDDATDTTLIQKK